jgi:antitoxin (DNA-binding transcriptional repressor) of toxin-antitoxin stability system
MDEFTIIGLKELRENMEAYITKIQRGDSFVVVKKSKVVFRIAPPDEAVKTEPKADFHLRGNGGGEDDKITKNAYGDEWEEVADFTKAKKGGIAINDLLSRL